MAEIQTFPFEKDKFDQIREYHFGLNWPVVYIQENGKEMYIGQTTNVFSRSNQHYDNPDRARLKRIHVVTDEEFNMSAACDFESLLIQYVSADGKFTLQNGNGGLVNHNYYEKEKYLAKLETIWPTFQKMGLVKQGLKDIKNSEFFKYSPYKALTEDQLVVAAELEKSIRKGEPVTHIVSGAPGTGKSILALYLLKHFKEQRETREIKMALVVPMTSLRSTLQRVVRRVPGLGADLIIGPSDVAKKKYDLLIVDEAHRLGRRVNLANYPDYEATNKKLGLDKEGTQLDWIMKAAKQQIFFYDARQSVIPKDIRPSDFQKLNAVQHELVSQMRVEGGADYLKFIDDLLSLEKPTGFDKSAYDFQLYDDVHKMVEDIKRKDSEHTLARVVAGYAWPWLTKKGKGDYDIEIAGLKLVWNSTATDWVNSKNAVNEVGCIHTIQGYDLNYAGVIIGPELTYDETEDKLVIDEKKYKDFNGKRSITEPGELQQYIVNIYKTLLTRGIKGTYVYVVDERLRHRLTHLLAGTAPQFEKATASGLVKSPITVAMVQVPLVGSAPCGNPLLGEENIEEYISVEKSKIKPGYKYFILRAEGDSMDKAGINDGDLVLCRQQEKADTGDRVVALLGGENVTIKEYGPRENGVRLLLPKSTNKRHAPITPSEGDGVQGIVQEVLVSG
ncbi:MAG TPA: hypothetical protein DHV25_03095 [Candidatus Kerfeldbacteria bacterium]|nr:hypothetical protein [Candidatus Kerfeldbacteria bacterium]